MLSIVLIVSLVNIVYGFGVGDLKGKPISNDTATNLGNDIIEIIATVGSILSVLILIIIGIKYMAGGVEEKVEYKKTFLPYVIGCLVLFGASTIAGIVQQVAKNI